MVQGVDGERRPTGIPSVTLPAAPDFSRLKLPAGLALGRETLGTSLLEECLELSQQPAEDPESKVGCDFCHKQEDIQKVSSVDQQTCLCKGKFDTEYVLFTPHALPVK